jgi:predicted RNA-binding protein with RPS1 domain
MTIDQNQTPGTQEEAPQSAVSAEQASDTPAVTPDVTLLPLAEPEISEPVEAHAAIAVEAAEPASASQPTEPEQILTPPTTAQDLVAPEAAAPEAAVPEPVVPEPVPVESVAVEPTPVEPVAVEPVPVESVAVEPTPVEPVAVEPLAVEPVAVAVEPVEATSSAEVPTEPVAAAEPAPSAPVAETPVVAQPVFAAPVEPSASAEPAGPRDEKADADLFESYMNALDSGEDAESAIDSGYKRLNKGDRIEATIIQVDRDKVFVDLGTKAEGIVPLGELSEENLESAKGHFHVGDKITVIVIRPEGAEGNPIVSKKRADFEEAWDRIEAAFRGEEMITAQVVDRVKGGLVVDVGVRGFVPATHVGSGKLRNIEKFVGQPLQLKVIEIDRDRKKVVLSNREAEEERRKSAKEEIFNRVKPGDRLQGTVRRLTDYGAFVDLGGVDGLLHISEMSWARINHPKEMFKEGQKIEVMVLRLDPGNSKISLGHRQVLPDPWNLIKDNYKVGQNLKIIIGRIVQSGAFIKLPEGAEAFMPVSEMSFRRIKRPQDVVEENQEVEAQIIDLRPDERRMVLSMRAIGGGGELRPGASASASGYEEDMRRADRGGGGGGGPVKKGRPAPGGKKGRGGREEFEDLEEIAGRRGFATGGATIGERLGALRGILTRDEDESEEKEEVATEEHAEE